MENQKNETDSKPREKKTLTAADLLELAEKMEHFGKRYRELAEQLGNGDPLKVGNWTTLKTSISHIKRAVNVAYEAFDERVISTGVFADADEAELNKRPPPKKPKQKIEK